MQDIDNFEPSGSNDALFRQRMDLFAQRQQDRTRDYQRRLVVAGALLFGVGTLVTITIGALFGL